MGSDLTFLTTIHIITIFQSTLPRGERQNTADDAESLYFISIHAPAWGATFYSDAGFCNLQFQSTLPRGERPETPVTSATSITNFNPRSRVGSDFMYRLLHQPSKNFNPRSRVGSDCISPVNGRKRTISIHAPAWGATKVPCPDLLQSIFQSTLPRGERRKMMRWKRNPKLFQSTLPRGERHKLIFHKGHSQKFQSTLPRGERRHHRLGKMAVHRFQSTLPRGERPTNRCLSCAIILFQSTLPRGERQVPDL